MLIYFKRSSLIGLWVILSSTWLINEPSSRVVWIGKVQPKVTKIQVIRSIRVKINNIVTMYLAVYCFKKGDNLALLYIEALRSSTPGNLCENPLIFKQVSQIDLPRNCFTSSPFKEQLMATPSFSSRDIFSLINICYGSLSEERLTFRSLSWISCPPSSNVGGAWADSIVSSPSSIWLFPLHLLGT